jgi:hypothetical protein
MEKRAHQTAVVLEGGEVLFHADAERLVLSQRSFRRALLPQMVPDELVGILIRGIAGQEVQFQFAPT